MDESASELDESFVEGIVWAVTISEPEFLQNIVRFKKEPTIEANEKAQIMRVEVLPPAFVDHGGDFCALFAHVVRLIQTGRENRKNRGCTFGFYVLANAFYVWRMAKPALGRGLGALLGGQSSLAKPVAVPATPVTPPAPTPAPIAVAPAPTPEPPNSERVLRVPLDRVQPSVLQPRKHFSPESLQELSDSIREQGILQPLIVRKRGEHLELIAGERRWRASEMAGLTEVPVIIRVADDATVLELMLIENLQREGLNAIEEALGYAQLATQFQLRQEDIAIKVGKSRVAVANALRLLKLAADVQVYVRDARISVGHAKVILGLNSEADQKLAAERVIKDGLTVRQTEELVAVMQAKQMAKGGSSPSGTKTPATRDLHLNALENRLLEKFGTKVALKYKQGKGSVEIKFFNDDDLHRILEIVGVNLD